jgi:ABC-2 type transport system permease protein
VNAIVATMRAASREAWANRTAFWTALAAMAINDIVWVLFWVLFFGKVGTVAGWDRTRVLLLLAIVTTGAGVVLSMLTNARRIGQLAADGGLDAALALPVRTLPYLLVRRVDAVNLGDVVFGLGLFLVACHPTPERAALYLLGTAAGATVLLGFLVLVGSLAFFTGRSDAGDLGFQAVILLASYPVDIFSGMTKVLLYTAIPAAFVSAVPARLVDHLDVSDLAELLGAAALFLALAISVFRLGLRRYTSTALWTRG